MIGEGQLSLVQQISEVRAALAALVPPPLILLRPTPSSRPGSLRSCPTELAYFKSHSFSPISWLGKDIEP